MTPRTSAWLLYGATGYTGAHIAERAVMQGMRPVLAGRSAAALRPLAERLGLEWRVVELDDEVALRKLVGGFAAVLHCAGPFLHTAQPMARACIAAGTHYLDITGEVNVYESLAAMHDAARAADVMLMPGVGFDMVPGDCLALMLKRQMPDAVSLDMGISFDGTLTRGTIRSALASFSPSARVRRAHALSTLSEPLAREFDFGVNGGKALAYAMEFGDISIAWRSTGIADITCYLRPSREFAALAGISSDEDIQALPAGPDADELRTLGAALVAEVRNRDGERRAARLLTPQIYAITFDLAARIAHRVAQGQIRSGFQTPAAVFGEDFILEFPGCVLQALD
ncbi:MAG: saccharopine dehydrogenase family protein [Panacagrimonas sp.]